jgi:hypothetical protein
MKSKTEQLENRGFIVNGIEEKYLEKTFEQRVELLKSNLPTDRTLGARMLANCSDLKVIDYLIDALRIENKLYSKIEISNSLASFGKEAVNPLIGLLGKIGNNQHKIVHETDFKKKNYPLPRDIASRTLIRIGTIALPDLLKNLSNDDVSKLSELIDTIGFICFYEYQENIFETLKDCFYRNEQNDLIKWKIFRAMSAFPESVLLLKEQLLTNAHLKFEIERSLALIIK